MNRIKLKEVLELINNGKYEDVDLTFENIKEKEYNISFLEEFQESWDGEYTCKILEIYEVTTDSEKLGYIGRIVRKSMHGIWRSSKFNIVVEEMVLRPEWRLL